MSFKTYEPTREKLQSLWDKLCPADPRTIKRYRLWTVTLKSGYKRYKWVAEGVHGYIELGKAFADSASTIRHVAPFKQPVGVLWWDDRKGGADSCVGRTVFQVETEGKRYYWQAYDALNGEFLAGSLDEDGFGDTYPTKAGAKNAAQEWYKANSSRNYQ